MAKVTGFLEFSREKTHYRPVEQRLQDWRQVMAPLPDKTLNEQAARCMDCGIPFCHQGCPLGNLIPDWNDLVYRNRWADAIERLHATNNFPEFTGTLCPAPCEGSCVLGINNDPVSIKAVELAIIDRAFAEGWIKPQPPVVETGRKVAIVGSGPAGLAAAQQLRRAGHRVTVFERDDRIGGLLRYGIPEFKMEKNVLDRRLEQLRAEGIEFRVNANVGVDVDVAELKRDFHAVLLAGGATVPREGLWRAQTPQLFRYALLRRALAEAPAATDESQAVESLGHRPRLVQGDNANFKVTFPEDLALAETILALRRKHA